MLDNCTIQPDDVCFVFVILILACLFTAKLHHTIKRFNVGMFSFLANCLSLLFL